MPLTPAAEGSLATIDPATGLPVSPSSVAAVLLTTPAAIYRQRDSGAFEGGVDDVDEATNRELLWSGNCRIEKPSGYKEMASGDIIQSVTNFIGIFPLTAPADPPNEVDAGGQTFNIVGNDRGVSDAVNLTARLQKVT